MVEVYLDVPFTGAFFSLIQDATLLWMVAQITALKPGIFRLMAGGLVGGVFQFFVLLNQSSGGVVDSWILSPVVFGLVPPLMLGVTFCPVRMRKLGQIGGYFYLLAFLLAGLNWGIDELNHRFWDWPFSFAWRFLFHLTFIFILGELGWGIIHRKIWEQVCLFRLWICWEAQQLETIAFLDTGNRLTDPLTKAPVIILELTEISRYLPPEVLAVVAKMARGELNPGETITPYWQDRFRILPFSTIGPEDGLLVGFRPEEAVVIQNGKFMRHRNVVVALCNRRVDPEGNFHALISPDLLTES